MPTCSFFKCCTNFFCCGCGFGPTKNTGIVIPPPPTGTNGRTKKMPRRSVVWTRADSEAPKSQRTMFTSEIKLKYEPDNGIVWNAFHWFGRWVFSAKVASLFIWALSLVFLRVHLYNYETNCDLKTSFILDKEIKQVWTTPNENNTFTNRCSLENNPIVGNVTNILIFLLTLALGAGLDKYKETLRLYEEVAGDIKAMAMLLVHLTFDGEKYTLKGDELQYKKDVENTYRKMKYLLSSLAPTIKNTIAGGEYTINYRRGRCSCPKMECSSRLFAWSSPFDALSDRKYYAVVKQNRIMKLFFSSTVEYPNYWKDAEDQVTNPQKYSSLEKPMNDRMRLVELIERTKHQLNAELQFALYKKIMDIHKHTEMDAAECSMTVLLDEMMRLFENGLGFGVDEGSAIASAAIDRWNSMYGTWGTLSSLKTFSEPLIVNMFRAALIGIYAWFMPKTYLKYYGILDEYWLFIFVGGDMLIFCLMWWLAFAVRNPFKNSFIIRNVNKLAYQTQYQVQQLMANQLPFDTRDYKSNSQYGYIGTLGRDGSKTIGFDIFKPTGEESIQDILARSLDQRNSSAKSNQQKLNATIALALKKQETIFTNFLDGLTVVLQPKQQSPIQKQQPPQQSPQESPQQPPPPPPVPQTGSETNTGGEKNKGLRRRGLGLNF